MGFIEVIRKPKSRIHGRKSGLKYPWDSIRWIFIKRLYGSADFGYLIYSMKQILGERCLGATFKEGWRNIFGALPIASSVG